ncbi:hypothetical protein E0H65_18425 [Rhizobium leguminosarum bv. viciae]|nr:hypothetical protein E0H65_18425 [Rhizobium leguminosarum bv. viciae]TCB11244.1 hypothetical protein E0J18_27025 [Rhizobium leguminosarum bv. viciae]TCB39049.1 hypothetical protein E0J02_25335 [Rhizobium leguminosarum bv. viciae]
MELTGFRHGSPGIDTQNEKKDKFENMGAKMLREVASKTNDLAGYGATTTTVLAPGDRQGACKGRPLAMTRLIRSAASIWPSPMTTRASASTSSACRRTPVRQIAEKAGAEGPIVVGKLRERSDLQFSWNGQAGEYSDLFKICVIDPAKLFPDRAP